VGNRILSVELHQRGDFNEVEARLDGVEAPPFWDYRESEKTMPEDKFLERIAEMAETMILAKAASNGQRVN
jgi:hypothetical protein